jgi:hypothetical protein
MKAIVHQNRIEIYPESHLEDETLQRWLENCEVSMAKINSGLPREKYLGPDFSSPNYAMNLMFVIKPECRK